MPFRIWVLASATAALGGALTAQGLRPGYIDPAPVLQAAEAAYRCGQPHLRHDLGAMPTPGWWVSSGSTPTRSTGHAVNR